MLDEPKLFEPFQERESVYSEHFAHRRLVTAREFVRAREDFIHEVGNLFAVEFCDVLGRKIFLDDVGKLSTVIQVTRRDAQLFKLIAVRGFLPCAWGKDQPAYGLSR